MSKTVEVLGKTFSMRDRKVRNQIGFTNDYTSYRNWNIFSAYWAIPWSLIK
jgi:hypothetical protein